MRIFLNSSAVQACRTWVGIKLNFHSPYEQIGIQREGQWMIVQLREYISSSITRASYSNHSLLSLLIVLIAFGTASGQSAPIIRAKQYLQIADFENAASLKNWSGLPIEQTSSRASKGNFGIKFDIPAWKKGDEERPRIVLDFAGGTGFPTKDFAPYGQIAVDVWVIGNEPGRMGLKLRDSKNHDSWTTWQDIVPGKMNTVLLKISDASADINVQDVQQIVLYGLRPPKPYTLIVDNLRLIPRSKPPLVEFSLAYPNYRGYIFPNAGKVEVWADVESNEYGFRPDQLRMTLTLLSGIRKTSKNSPLKSDHCELSISPEKMPYGPIILTASIEKRSDGFILSKREWTLSRLTGAEVHHKKVYLDRKNAAIVDGKPFFPLGFYSGGTSSHMEEIADSPFNCILDYGTNTRAKSDMLAYMDRMQKRGLKLIYCLNDLYPTANYVKSWEGLTGNLTIENAVVKAYQNHPALLAWYINDEIPAPLAPNLLQYYRSVRSADPDHPCYMVHCNRYALPYFADSTDIMGIDPYPIPKNPVTEVSSFLDFCNSTSKHHKPTWVVPQVFGWYQYSDENLNRGRIPTEEELKSGRAPSYSESRCMTYLSLVHGAKGLIYYCYYDMRALPQYNEMWEGMKKIAGEVRTLSSVLLEGDYIGTVEISTKNTPLHFIVKRYQGRYYMITVNSVNKSIAATFNLKKIHCTQITEMFKETHVETIGAIYQTHYAPYEARVFQIR